MTHRAGQELRGGRYRILRQLGQGGMGAVYLATDRSLQGVHVAIKENLETARHIQEQFAHEAQTLSRLRHPNLPRVTDYFIAPNGRQYLVMDYVDGEDLGEILTRRRTPLPEAEVLVWMDQILDALRYMHSWVDPKTQRPNPVIHRDIKPGNIKRTTTGRIMLVDFGIAKYVTSGETHAGARAYSPGFSPMEQYTGGTDARSDVYAVGATLYALLTRQIPPDALSLAQGTPLPPPRAHGATISRKTERAILRAMSVAPQDRYQSVEEFQAALSQSRWLDFRIPTPRLPFIRPATQSLPTESSAQGSAESARAASPSSRPTGRGNSQRRAAQQGSSTQRAPAPSGRSRRRTNWAGILVSLLFLLLVAIFANQFVNLPGNDAEPASVVTLGTRTQRAAITGTDANGVEPQPPNDDTPPPAAAAVPPAATDAAQAAVPQLTPTEIPTGIPTETPDDTSSAASNATAVGATSSATATAADILAVVRNATATPLLTNTPTATPTSTPIPTATPRPTSTPTLTPTQISPTSTATETATRAPTASPTVQNSPSPAAPARSAAGAAVETPIEPSSSELSVELVRPVPSEAVLRGTVDFEWRVSGELAPGEAYELVFWPVEGTAMANGFGPRGWSLGTTVSVDLDRSANELPQLQSGRSYRWGVLLVQPDPYVRIRPLATGHRFTYQGGGGSSGDDDDGGGDDEGGSGGGGGSTPAPPPTSPPAPPPYPGP